MTDPLLLVQAVLSSPFIKVLLALFALLAAVAPVLRWWEDRKNFALREREVAALERQASALELLVNR